MRRRTGCSVVLLTPPAMAFADARGGWPGTYDTAASDLGKTFIERHALLLTGGDVYGFDAAAGIRRFLLERKLASPTGGGKMPAIMGTNIYDLGFADTKGLDYADLGYTACLNASTKPVFEGNVGGGTGATVGPFFGTKG
ncbi:MAG: peptidase S58 family protein, partial [Methanobacteriota archaeon]